MEDAISYDASTDRHYVEFTPDQTESVTETIVFSIAEIIDHDPIELPPIGNVVNTDSLDWLFSTRDGVDPQVSVSFEYTGHVVVVSGHGRISFTEHS